MSAKAGGDFGLRQVRGLHSQAATSAPTRVIIGCHSKAWGDPQSGERLHVHGVQMPPAYASRVSSEGSAGLRALQNRRNGYCHHKYLPTAEWYPLASSC